MTMQKTALALAIVAIGATIVAAWVSIFFGDPRAQPYMRLLEVLLSWEVVSVAGLAAVGPSVGKAIRAHFNVPD
jgi:hypothetical protein